MPTSSLFFSAHGHQIGGNHLLHHIIEARLLPPAEPLTRLRRIAE